MPDGKPRVRAELALANRNRLRVAIERNQPALLSKPRENRGTVPSPAEGGIAVPAFRLRFERRQHFLDKNRRVLVHF